MRYVNDLTEKENGLEALMADPGLFHMMNVLDVGEEEALAMIEAVRREDGQEAGGGEATDDAG